MKKYLVFFLILTLLFTLVSSCDKKDDKKQESTGDSNEPIEFTMFIADINPNYDDYKSPVAQKIKEKTGVTLKIEHALNSEAAVEKVALMAATGDYPEFVFAKGELNKLKDNLVQLDEPIEKFGPNIKKFYGDQISRLKWNLDDPHIYHIGGYAFGDETTEPGGFMLQHAVVKELGYPKLETLQDFEDAIKAYKEKYPKIDGQDTIGYSLVADDWRFLISVSNPAAAATGAPDNGEWYVDPDTLKLKRHILRPEEREYFRWLNHMNDIGLLDKESFVQKDDQYKSKIATGRVLGLSDARWAIGDPIKALKGEGKEERTYGYYPLTLEKGVKYPELYSPGYTGGHGIGITDKCKDVERAIKFFDWMCTDEAQILVQWGIEGEHYDIVDGKRVWKTEVEKGFWEDPKWQKETGIGNYVYPFPHYGNAVKDSTGQYYTPTRTIESVIKNQTDIENEVLKAYGVTTWKELYPQKEEFPIRPYGAMWMVNIDNEDIKAKDNKIMNIGYKMLSAAVTASPAEFDAKFDAYLKAIKEAGLDEVTAEYQKALDDRLTLWGK